MSMKQLIKYISKDSVKSRDMSDKILLVMCRKSSNQSSEFQEKECTTNTNNVFCGEIACDLPQN